MPTVTRREFLNSPKAPLPVAQLVKEAALTPAAVQQADRDNNGRIEGRAELGALWDAGISKGDTFERTKVVKPAFSFAQPVASPEARRLAAVDPAAMVAAVPGHLFLDDDDFLAAAGCHSATRPSCASSLPAR